MWTAVPRRTLGSREVAGACPRVHPGTQHAAPTDPPTRVLLRSQRIGVIPGQCWTAPEQPGMGRLDQGLASPLVGIGIGIGRSVQS